MKTKISKWYSVLSPRPTVIVSTISQEGISNAAPFSFVMPVSADPPLISFASAPQRHTLENLRVSGDFVINIPSIKLLQETWGCSKALPKNVSEIKAAGLTEIPSKIVKSPQIKECFARLECKLSNEYKAGDHILVIGEVVHLEVDDCVLENNVFNAPKAQLLLHIGSNIFSKIDNFIKYEE